MIQHIVLLDLPADFDAPELSAIMRGLSDLVGDIDGFTAFTQGPNLDFEKKSAGYAYGFICSFANQSALQSYTGDPRHQALGARLVALCNGGGGGIFVADIET